MQKYEVDIADSSCIIDVTNGINLLWYKCYKFYDADSFFFTATGSH